MNIYALKKKLVDSKEKNFYYLNKLKDCIKTQKYKDNKNMLLELNIHNPNNTKIKGNNNLSNLVIKKYFNNRQCLSENDKEKNNEYNIEQDENFFKLNEYEQNNIKQLIKEHKEIKRYKVFIDKVLKNKKFFKIIDSDDIVLSKKKEIKSFNSFNNKKKLKLKIDNNNNNNNINENSKDILFSEENNDLSSINSNSKNDSNKKENFFRKKYLTKKLSLTLYNHNSNIKLFKFPSRKSNYIGLNMKNFSEKDINLNAKISNKKYSFSKGKENYENIFQEIKRDKEIKKTEVFTQNNFLKNYINQKIPKVNKEKSLNYLFNNLNTSDTPNQQYINEYKKYFSKNKNMSESDLNEFIKRNYEPKDFYNLVSTVDDIIKSADIEDKWRKKYTKIGKIEEIKNFLDEEKKQDLYINHLLKNFVLAKYGIFKLYEYK